MITQQSVLPSDSAPPCPSTHSTRLTSFLDLPAELRNAIYEAILDFAQEVIHITLIDRRKSSVVLRQTRRYKLDRVEGGWYNTLKSLSPTSNNLAIALVNKQTACEALPFLYATAFAFSSLNQLNVFLGTIKDNAKHIRDIQLTGADLCDTRVPAQDFTKLLAANSLRSITIPHLHLCVGRFGAPWPIRTRVTIPTFVDLVIPLLLRRQQTLKQGSILDFVKIAKSDHGCDCVDEEWCLEYSDCGAMCDSDETETLFQEVKTKLRASIADALGVQED